MLPVRVEHIVVVQVAIIHIANIEIAIVRVGIDTARSHPSIMPYYFNYYFVAIITKIISTPFPCWPAWGPAGPRTLHFKLYSLILLRTHFHFPGLRAQSLEKLRGKGHRNGSTCYRLEENTRQLPKSP